MECLGAEEQSGSIGKLKVDPHCLNSVDVQVLAQGGRKVIAEDDGCSLTGGP